MTGLPSVSVVITTYRRRDRLPEVVAAVAADPHATEIVVVVDGCQDGSYELLAGMAATDPRLRPIWRANGGENAARQTGVEAATGEVVLVLDDDVVAGPRLAEGHARVHERVPGAVVVGYMPTAVPATRQPGSFTTELYAAEYERACRRYEDVPGSVLSALWAGNISLRRADALRVGFGTTNRLGYHEDQEFGLRCARAGLVGVFDRTLRASHHHLRDLGSFLRQARLAGTARRFLAEDFPELGPVTDPLSALPRALRPAVRAAAGPLYWPAAAVLLAATRACGALRLFRAESVAGRLLRQIELARGFHHA